MNIVNLIQGSPEWHAHRKQHHNASDAPAMMGCSPYKTRDELIREAATGVTAEVDAATQRRFDDGHRFEALARSLAEKIVGEDLYPVTGVNGKLSASFDGLTLGEDTAFEHKSLNDSLRYTPLPWYEGNGDHLPLHYRVQMEHQLLVSGADRVLFMASKWDANDQLIEERHCWYASDAELRARIVAGWAQFDADVAAYTPAQAAAVVVAEPVESLPAVSVRLDGAIAVASNLDVFGQRLRVFVDGIDKSPSTDQAFANAEAAVTVLKKAEDALDAAEASALAQIDPVEAMRRAVADYKELARSTRLALEKIVKTRKEQIRGEIVANAAAALNQHIIDLNASIGLPVMPRPAADFASAIKGKKTVESLRNAVNTELANAKIEASATAERIRTNIAQVRRSPEFVFLFPDLSSICLKPCDDFATLVESRISNHQAKEAQRLEAERQRIREEEEAKARREAAAQAAAQMAAQVVATAKPEPAPAPIAAPEATATPFKPRQVEHTMSLGQINARLAPLSLSCAGLRELGFQPVGKDRATVLFREADFPAICRSISKHALNAAQPAMA